METKHFQGPGFTMQIPTDWFITSSPQFQAMFVAPASEFGIRANLAVSMTPVKEDVTARMVAENARKNQEIEYAEYSVLGEDEAVTPDKSFTRIYKWYNSSKNMHLLQKQIFLVVNQMLFTVTSTRQIGEETEEIDAILEEMI